MPRYDFGCEKCETVVELFLPLTAYDEAKDGIQCVVEGCKGTMIKVPAAPGFKVRGGTPKFGPR